jgi:glycosyltransferase involved in cell wall biosynthesis
MPRQDGSVQFLLIRSEPASCDVAERTLRLHNPGARVAVFDADPRSPGVAGLRPRSHERFGGLRWADFALGLGANEASWAVLPWTLEKLVAAGVLDSGQPIGVMDDDFWVGGPLDSLFVSPSHLVARPAHVDGVPWGGFLHGLVVVPGSLGWAGWWKDRALEDVRSEEPSSVWWQLPQDSVALADPELLVSSNGPIPALMRGDDDTSDGRRPRLVQFPGFDPRRPWLAIDQEHGMERGLPQVFRGVVEEYAADLLAAGWQPPHSPQQVMPGLRATPELRAWYRSVLAASGSADLPPNPYAVGEVGEFLDLLGSSGEHSGLNVQVDLLLESREDLAQAFPSARWKDRVPFQRWMWSHGLSEGAVSLAVLPDPPLAEVEFRLPGVGNRPFGVNLVGYLGAELGLGVAARRLRAALDAAGIPNTTVSYDRTSSNIRDGEVAGGEAPYHFNLLLITPDQLPLFVQDAGPEFLRDHHNIGLWYWESDVMAPQQVAALDLVDEIWVATDYLTRAFSGHGRRVTVVPSPLVFEQPAVGAADRGRLGLDDRFTYLFSFDFLSEPERKNAIGLAEAYRRAFPEPGDTVLIIKSINGRIFPESLEHLRWETADRADVVVRDELLSAEDRLGLVAAADCYVSLHRSEGLGLTMAEAMALGTPVIATAYSGNLDFMPEGSALLVPATEVEVGPGHYYPPEGHWADPDLDAAAEMMRRVKADPALRLDLAAAGRLALEPFGYEQVGGIALLALLEAWDRTRG